MSRSAWPILLGLACILFMLAGASWWVGHRMDARTAASAAWPTVEGEVVRSAVSIVEYRDSKDGQLKYRPRLDFAYAYEVDGRAYEGSRYDASGAWPSGDVHAFAAEHPVGTHVQVHYDPDDPARSGLSVAGPGQTVGFRIMAYGLAALALVFAAFGMRSLLRHGVAE